MTKYSINNENLKTLKTVETIKEEKTNGKTWICSVIKNFQKICLKSSAVNTDQEIQQKEEKKISYFDATVCIICDYNGNLLWFA